nr:MAG TPA: hypothetical protein [Caudoviricetes sp.]
MRHGYLDRPCHRRLYRRAHQPPGKCRLPAPHDPAGLVVGRHLPGQPPA